MQAETETNLEQMTTNELEDHAELCELQTQAILEQKPVGDQAVLELCERIARDWKRTRRGEPVQA